MNFDTYQRLAKQTDIYTREVALTHKALGLAGEAGEVANKVKKIGRDHEGVLTDDVRRQIAHELGDVLWYVAALADELGVSLGSIAEENLAKLRGRVQRDTLAGDGDNR